MGNSQPFLPGPATWCPGCRGSAGGCTQEEDGEEGRQAGQEALCAHSPQPSPSLAVSHGSLSRVCTRFLGLTLA